MGRWRWLLVAILSMAAAITPAIADEGDFDPTFSADGYDLPDLPDNSFGSALAIDRFGRIVAVGHGGSPWQPLVVRYQPDGDLDASFGNAGVVIIPLTGRGAAVVVDAAGRIVVAGTDQAADDVFVARILDDGALDSSLAGDGIATAPVGGSDGTTASMAIDPTGRIVVSGSADNGTDRDAFVARFLADGSLDSSFADSGLFVLDSGGWESGGDVAVDDSERIVLATATGASATVQDPQLVRLLDDGTLDGSFGTGGKVLTPTGPYADSAHSLQIDPIGRIVIAGHIEDATRSNEDLLVMRYLPDGSLDPSFDGDGIVVNAMSDGGDGALAVGFDRVGNIIIGGHTKGCCLDSWDFALWRYQPDGSLDSTFADDGVAIESIRGGYDSIADLAIDRNGDIVVVGSAGGGVPDFEFWVGRFKGAGWFIDDTGSVFENDINALAASGITRGCNPPSNDRYCPLAEVTRGQMAAFLNRALDLPASAEDFFVDDGDSVFADDINRLAAAGITAGCNPPVNDRYCLLAEVTRGQMAAFLNRALDLPASAEDFFVDDGDSVFADDINRLAAAGITAGCNPPDNDRFCPSALITRGQMAAFLVRAFDLN